jgi:predicted dithiol-disulfide oxidoreductase (DUF899 family)
MTKPKIVSKDAWIESRKAILAKEKNLTRLHDDLARERQRLPWTRVEKNYTFDAPQGKRSLADLFGPHSQLFVYHFMFGPDWKEGCPSCSYVCDHLNGTVPHLAARDVSLTMISRAPLAKIEAFKKRMGWQFPWVSSNANDFNHDFGVYFTPDEMARGEVNYNYTMQKFPNPEAPGASIFYKDKDGQIYHTNSIYGRGLDAFITTYTLLDLVPKGRDEDNLPFSMLWVRHHDKYATGELLDKDRPYWPKVEAAQTSSCCQGHP